MTSEAIEIYRPRDVSHLGQWEIDGLQLKIYGLIANRKSIDDAMLRIARSFVQDEVIQRVRDEGDDNGTGFVIIHPGDAGISISAHWWIQGSVLCQHIYRKLYLAAEPLDTVKRPVIGCVWELAIINAEQEAWRKTMMKNEPDLAEYLSTWADFDVA